MGFADIDINFLGKGKDGEKKIFWELLRELNADSKEIKKTLNELAIHNAEMAERWKYGCEPVIKLQATQELIKKLLGVVGILSLGHLIWSWMEKR